MSTKVFRALVLLLTILAASCASPPKEEHRDAGVMKVAWSSPVVYQDGGAALTTGAAWTAGPYAAVPAGAANAVFWITYTGVGGTSQLSYRMNLFYAADAGAGGVSRVLASAPTISGSTATQVSYKSVITLADVGTAPVVVPVPVSVTGGAVGVSIDLQEAVQPDAGSTYSIALAWSYN